MFSVGDIAVAVIFAGGFGSAIGLFIQAMYFNTMKKKARNSYAR